MQDEPEPVDRAAWRRALEREGGEPPRATDARIRAEARRALEPRTGRWWLPASLAASLVLAVMMVQVQYEDSRRPVFAPESDVAAPPAAAPAPVTAPDAADAAITEAPSVLQDAPPVLPPAEESFEFSSDMPPAEATEENVQAPRIEQPAASEAKREVTVTGNRAQEAPAAPTAQPEGAAEGVIGNVGMERSSKQMRTDARTPEDWYAEIGKLRAAGRHEEAQAELAKLAEAHPGWLERHHPEELQDSH
jgi:hypothetical protein